jgi:hypothetical protein
VFLRSLHGAPVGLTPEAPHDEIGRSNLPLRLQALDSRMDHVAHDHRTSTCSRCVGLPARW